MVREVKESEKEQYNKLVSHIIQSWEWGEFRKKTGVIVRREGEFRGDKMISAWQVTFHKVPYLPYRIGYFPKGDMPTKLMVDSLTLIGKKEKAAFIKIEPNVITGNNKQETINILQKLGLTPSKKSLFTKYNFLIDLAKSEDQLLAQMHPKTRYNIKVAQKKEVEVHESVEDRDFEIYLKLYFDTTKRQKYFGHTPHYHRLAWKILKDAGMARLLIARYQPPGTIHKIPLVAWMLFNFGDTLYYPYGGSSSEYKEVMASNLVAWEAIRLGKKMRLKTLDLWGALGPEADPKDPWHGFHRFKAGYGPKHVEYIGTYDLVLNPALYEILTVADKVRWALLRATKR